MTLRYAHVHDAEVEAAAERIGEAILRICETPSASVFETTDRFPVPRQAGPKQTDAIGFREQVRLAARPS